MRGFPLQQHAVLQVMLRCFPWYCPHSPLLSTDLSQLHQHLDRHRQGAEGVESVREASMRQLLSTVQGLPVLVSERQAAGLEQLQEAVQREGQQTVQE